MRWSKLVNTLSMLYNTIILLISFLGLIWGILIYKGDEAMVSIELRRNVKNSELKEYFKSLSNGMFHLCMMFFMIFLFNIFIKLNFILKVIINIYLLIFTVAIFSTIISHIQKKYSNYE